uniref:Uncharacterized protein n=1 Tax=Triticum urartu TaxID=4572 RepID=A0A8R7TV37_TRIUA
MSSSSSSTTYSPVSSTPSPLHLLLSSLLSGRLQIGWIGCRSSTGRLTNRQWVVPPSRSAHLEIEGD